MNLSADAYNARELANGRITSRHVTEMTRSAQRELDLVVDGKCGPITRAALGAPDPADPVGEPPDQRDDVHGPFDGPLGDRIPKTRTDVYRVFGDPGTPARPNRAWARAHIITVRDLPGVPARWHFKVHRAAEPYVREALRRASWISGYRIDRAACWVLRHVQHDRARPLSLHSWGIAVDVDPRRNRALRFKRGQAPRPWSDEWRDLWPDGVDQPFVEAFEAVGFTWGGVWGQRLGDYADRAQRIRLADPMHFELRAGG